MSTVYQRWYSIPLVISLLHLFVYGSRMLPYVPFSVALLCYFAVLTPTAQKMKFSIKDLVTFTGEILNGKHRFLCSVPASFLDHASC